MTMTRRTYYAKDGIVWKSPVERKNEDGTTSVTIGFPVCRMHEAVGKEAAGTVAILLNLGALREETMAALEGAEHALDSLDPRGGKLVHPPPTEVLDEAMFLVKSAIDAIRCADGVSEDGK